MDCITKGQKLYAVKKQTKKGKKIRRRRESGEHIEGVLCYVLHIYFQAF
jgi:hypothetical protein